MPGIYSDPLRGHCHGSGHTLERERLALAVTLAAMLAGTTGCSNMSTREQYTARGVGLGAATGAGIAAIAGGSGWTGAAIGAVVGGVIGNIVGKDKQQQQQQ